MKKMMWKKIIKKRQSDKLTSLIIKVLELNMMLHLLVKLNDDIYNQENITCEFSDKYSISILIKRMKRESTRVNREIEKREKKYYFEDFIFVL